MSASPAVVDQAMAVPAETPGWLRARLVEEHQRQLERMIEAAASLRGRGGKQAGGLHAPNDAERDGSRVVLAQAREIANEIEMALERLDAGASGRCHECGQPLPLARPEAIPYT